MEHLTRQQRDKLTKVFIDYYNNAERWAEFMTANKWSDQLKKAQAFGRGLLGETIAGVMAFALSHQYKADAFALALALTYKTREKKDREQFADACRG